MQPNFNNNLLSIYFGPETGLDNQWSTLCRCGFLLLFRKAKTKPKTNKGLVQSLLNVTLPSTGGDIFPREEKQFSF